MAKGKTFDRPVAVAVEGIDFLHLMRTQFDGTACPNLWLYDLFEDREDSRGLADVELKGNKQTQWLRNFQRQAKEAHDFKVRTLAIVRDAEDNAAGQFQAVCHALAAVELPQPTANGSYATGSWQGLDGFRVGVLVIPHDNPTGCLESCLLRAPKLNYGTKPAADFLAEVELGLRTDAVLKLKLEAKTLGGLSRWREKVRVRAMIAASPDDPGQQLGPSGNWLWDFTMEPLKTMAEFITEARNPSSHS